jgi:ABC-type uncharacterized transport system permease subunit
LGELLFWPALVAYGEAAVALVGEARRPGAFGRAAIWGVRVGWLAQTGLLAWQAASADGFPWSSRAGALNLFVWLVVGAYLIWGCRPRFRVLGLAVVPPAAVLLGASYVAGGTGEGRDALGALLALHVGLILAALAGFTVAAGLAALYLWHERRLKRRERTILRLPVPPLDTLDRLSARVVAVSLAVLTGGIALGVAQLARDGGGADVAMAATVAVWAVYGGLVASQRAGALRGRRAARGTAAAFVLVLVLLVVAHF